MLPLSSPSVQQGRLLHDELSLAEGALEVLVCRSNGRRETGCVKSHLSGVAYPAGSFVRVPVADVPGVYAASPELVFRQIAAKHSLLETVYVGYALCSSYRVDGAVEGGIALREGDDEPLTSVRKSASRALVCKGRVYQPNGIGACDWLDAAAVFGRVRRGRHRTAGRCGSRG